MIVTGFCILMHRLSLSSFEQSVLTDKQNMPGKQIILLIQQTLTESYWRAAGLQRSMQRPMAARKSFPGRLRKQNSHQQLGNNHNL